MGLRAPLFASGSPVMDGSSEGIMSGYISIMSMEHEFSGCTNHIPTKEEAHDFAVDVFRRAVAKANGHVGYGPKAVAAWAYVRAWYRGYMDHSGFWYERAVAAGEVDDDFLTSPTLSKVKRRLDLEERLWISMRRWKAKHEKVWGVPLWVHMDSMDKEWEERQASESLCGD